MAHGLRSLAFVAIGLLVGWWLYVPVHELLHAAGCVVGGGTVTRLEISPIYLGGPLAAIFPWVEAGGEYAGRLSGFDVHGSDWTYLLTDFAPFLLTLLPGVWLLRHAARRRQPFVFGAALPLALAPFTSITGDAYEIGSILATRLPPWSSDAARQLLRGDDVFYKITELADVASGRVWAGLLAAFLIGLLWAFLTCALGAWIASRLGQAPLSDPKSTALNPS